MHEPHPQVPTQSLLPGVLPILAVLAILILPGCGLEKPQAPEFDTNLYIPIGAVRTTGLDILEDNPHVVGDSAGAEPMAIVIDGEVERFLAEDVLDFSIGPEALSATIDTIQFENPDDIEVDFSLEEVSGLPIPPEGIFSPVPPFVFPELHEDLEDRTEFAWIRLLEGQARIQVENRLPVPIGAEEGPRVLQFQLTNRGADTAIDTELRGEVPPGETWSWDVDLAGIELGRQLDIDVYGGSVGSQGGFVWVEPSQGIIITIFFDVVRPDSLIAAIEEQSFSVRGAFPLADDLKILEGRILSGMVPVEVTNRMPLEVTANLSFPELSRDGQILKRSELVEAAESGGTSQSNFSLDLANVSVTASDAIPTDSISYRLDVETLGSLGAEVALGRNQSITARLNEAGMGMSWMRGSAEARQFEVPVTETEIDLPDEIDDLEFTQATLVVDVTSTIGFATAADLVLEAIGGDEAASLPFQVDIPPGDPATQVRIELDEANSNVLDIIHAQPHVLRVSGSVFVGQGAELATVSRDDWIEGTYSLTTPLRVRVNRIEQEIDPFSFTVPEDDQERIREDVLSAELEGELENHLPLAVVGSLAFADREADLDSAPDVVLDSVRATPAVIDLETGRASEATVTGFRVELEPEEIDFFARDEVWARFELTALGDGILPVTIVATDYVELRGHLKLRVDVSP